MSYHDMSDEELVRANRDFMEQKERIRSEQLKINAVQTDRAQRGVRAVYATKDRPFRKNMQQLIEVPINVSDKDLLALEGIHTEEKVTGLG